MHSNGHVYDLALLGQDNGHLTEDTLRSQFADTSVIIKKVHMTNIRACLLLLNAIVSFVFFEIKGNQKH